MTNGPKPDNTEGEKGDTTMSNETTNNTVALSKAQIEEKILADALPHVAVLKSGATSNRPLTRKEFKEKFGLSNSDAKRMHSAHCATFEIQQKLGVAAAMESGYRIVKTTMKNGARGERMTVAMVRSNNDARETLRQQIARLTATIAELKKAPAKG